MSLYFVTSRDQSHKNRLRKQYEDGRKLEDLPMPYFWRMAQERGIDGSDLTSHLYGAAVKHVREKNLAWGLTTAKPYADLSRFDGATCRKGLPLTDGKGHWRKRKELLEEEYLTHACLDLDKEHPLVSKVVTSPDITSYVRITKSLLPILCNRELVAFFSSSIVADNKDKPNRMNLRVVVFFDKPYPREIVKRWIKTIGKVEIDGEAVDFIDPALVNKGVVDIVANPLVDGDYSDNDALKQIHIEQGSRITINVSDLGKANLDMGNEGRNFENGLSVLTDELLKRENHWKKLANSGKLEGNRNQLLYKEIFREIAIKGKYEAKALVQMFDRNEEIVADKDIWQMYEDACFYIYNELTGREFGTCADVRKIVSTLDLAEYDISDLDTRNKVIALKSGCGTNKTKGFIKKLIKKGRYKRVLYVSLLKATIEPTARDISFTDQDTGAEVNFAYYEAMGKERNIKEAWCRGKDFLAITNKSLDVLVENGRMKPFDLVIIDEAEQVAIDAINYQSAQMELFDFCRHAETVLLLDADATDDLTGWLAREIADNAKDAHEFIALLNNKDWMSEGHKVFELNEERDVIGIIDKLLMNGKRVFLHVSFKDSDERKRISAICRYFKKRYKNKGIYGFDSKTAPDELRKNSEAWIDNKINAGGLDLLIHSPWSKIGWDYLGNNTFDACVGWYPSKNMTAPDIAQATRRMRLTKLHYIYIGTNGQQRCLSQAWYDSLFNDEFGLEYADTVGMTVNHKKQLAEIARKRRRIQQTNIREHFEAICRDRGARYIKHFTTDQVEQDILDLLTIEGENSLEAEARAHFESYKHRTKLLDKYREFNREGYEEYPHDPEYHWQSPQIKDFEEFFDLYKRDIRNEEFSGDIEDLSRIWYADKEQRVLLDVLDDQYMAVLQSLITDKVDGLMNMGHSLDNHFIDFLNDPQRLELSVLYENASYQPIKETIVRFEDRLKEAMPRIRISEAKTKFGILIEDLATMYDLQVDRRTATTSDRKARPKTQQNKEIIAAYIDAEAIPEGTGPRQALQLVEANIREKIKAGEPLHWLEQIHAGYMGHYLVLSKNKVLSKKIDFAISEGLSHEIFSTT